MSIKRKKLAVVGAGLAGLAVVGGVLTASGAANASPLGSQTRAVVESAAAATTSEGGAEGSNENGSDKETRDGSESTITGTVKAPAERGEGANATEASDASEAKALQALAKVSSAAAQQTATAAVPGSVTRATLTEENGWVVHQIEIRSSTGAATQVIVDAGTGKVLAREAGDAESKDDSAGAADTGTDSRQ